MKTLRPAALTLVAALFAPLLYAAAPTVALRFSPATAVYGQQVTITATVQGAAGATPTGSVALRHGEGAIKAIAPLDATGSAELKTTFLNTTTERSAPNVEVTYSGDSNYDRVVVTQRYAVTPASTRLTLYSSINPSTSARPATITGFVTLVAPSAGMAGNGTVTFEANGKTIGTSSVTDGTVAPFTLPNMSTGSHTITAGYSAGEAAANPNFKPSTTTLVQNVVQGTRVGATARVSGRSTVIEATVAASDEGVVPFGMVRFSEGSSLLGTAQLDSTGRAVITIENLGYGSHNVTVTFIGDARFAAGSTNVEFTVDGGTPRVTSVIADEGHSGRTAIELKVTLPSAAPEAVSFGYTTMDGATVANDDYVASTGVVAFAAGEREKSLQLEIIGGRKPESNEQFIVRFSAARGITPPADAQITIRDDDPAFAVSRDITYATVDGEELLLDLRVPLEGSGPFPIIMVIDADDWATPNSHSVVADFMAARGFAVATVGFRPSLTARFPAQLVDVRNALQWLRTHARDYNLQATRAGVWGIGAGGHLAALLGTTDPTILGVVDWYGASDLVQLQSDVTSCADHVSTSSPAATLLGCPPASCPSTALPANPIGFITRDDPPFLIMHGQYDCIVPAAQSRLLHDALTTAGARSTLLTVDAGRGGAAWATGAVTEPVAKFFIAQLNAPVKRSRAVSR